MALINCPECGIEGVSSEAETCKSCGFPIKRELAIRAQAQEEAERKAIEDAAKQRSANWTALLVIAGVIAAMIAIASQHPH